MSVVAVACSILRSWFGMVVGRYRSCLSAKNSCIVFCLYDFALLAFSVDGCL